MLQSMESQHIGQDLGTEQQHSFIYFWPHWVFIAARGLSLAAMSRGFSLVAVCGLLIAVALVAEHGL